MTLADILAECRNGAGSVHASPERATWFRQMLRNAIANETDKVEFFGRHDPSHNVEHHYNCITRCEHALNAISKA